MKSAKHIGCICALAVALGVGLAVANTPAVALAAPADSGSGSSSGDSSPSSSSGGSGSTPSDTPSAKGASAATDDDAPGAVGPSTSTASTGRSGTRATPATREATSRPGSGFTPTKTSENKAVVDTPAAEGATSVSSVASTTQSAAATPVGTLAAEPVPLTADATALAPPPPAPMAITPAPADPPTRVVSTTDTGAPTAPVEPPAALTLLAFARREFEPAFSSPSATANPLAGQITNSATDPDFISSTRNFFGLFSLTSAGDPSDNNYVAVVLETPIFTFVLTSGTDPEDNLGFGAASIGVAGNTVGTFLSPFLNFSIAIPIEDPFAELFIDLIRLGLV